MAIQLLYFVYIQWWYSEGQLIVSFWNSIGFIIISYKCSKTWIYFCRLVNINWTEKRKYQIRNVIISNGTKETENSCFIWFCYKICYVSTNILMSIMFFTSVFVICFIFNTSNPYINKHTNINRRSKFDGNLKFLIVPIKKRWFWFSLNFEYAMQSSNLS